ncbi:MAG: DUF4440 domain-containing protein [Chthoniobacterales bacterium]
MKLSQVALAISFAALPCLAIAQEESPTPTEKLSLRATDSSAEMEPSVSVPSERTMKEYPRPGASAAPSPSPKKAPSPKAEKSEKPARTKSPEPTKAASPTPSPSPAAANAPVPKAPVAAVKAMENRWLTALQSHDTNIVQTLVADGYIGVTATGRFVNKAGLLAEIKKDKNNYTSGTNTRMDVRVHGDAAVVVGTTRQIGSDETGKQFIYSYRWTDTWAQRNGQWLCVASQSTQVPNQQTLL